MHHHSLAMRLRAGGFARAPPPVPRMPGGLVQLMEGLTRDVLQHNPADVLEFCAAHMEQLLVIRDGRAPAKQPLTLDQKIKRAQEKVRERAEQRRQKYDKELEKVGGDLVKSGSSSSEIVELNNHQEEKPILAEIKPNIKEEKAIAKEEKQVLEEKKVFVDEDKPILKDKQHILEEEKIVLDENKSILEEKKDTAHSAIETKLKVPIHHEQDLSEALEVEIFHKPVEESHDKKVTESKDSNMTFQNESIEQVGNINEDIETPGPNNLNSEENKSVSKADNDFLNQVISDEMLQDSHDHVRTRRNASLLENVEEDEKTTRTAQGLERKKSSDNGTGEFELEIQNDTITEDENNPFGNKHNDAKEDLHENMENEAELKHDSITVVTNEVSQLAETSDTKKNNIISLKENNDSDNPGVAKERSGQNIAKADENILLDGILESKGEVDENLKKLEEVSTEVNKNISSAEVTTDDGTLTTAQEEEINIEHDKTQEEINNSTTPNKNNSMTAKSEVFADTNITANTKDYETIIIKKSLENITENVKTKENISHNESVINEHTDVNRQKILSLDNEKDILKAMDELEVCVDPIELQSDNKDDDLNLKEKNTTEGDFCTVEQILTKVPNEDEHATESNSGVEENVDNAVTSIDKILVDESGERDDNDSVPDQQKVENTFAEDNTILTNGTHEHSEIMENGNEHGQLVNSQDITKEVELMSEIQDDATNTSEPLKTDLETSSLGKSSSMDDSFIDEGVDTITEVDEMKRSSDPAQNKANSTSMDLETAAITIQKVFRTFLFKSRESTFDETAMGGNSIDGDIEKTNVEFPVTTASLNKERRTLGISRMDTVLQTVNEEKSLSLSDDSSLSSAATIIQAHVRGFLTRNRLNSNKTNSSSLVNSDGPSSTSFENDVDQKANKTVLNIHIVPEGEHFLSRDESLLTSMELSLDGSPPTSTNLHPLGYDKNEPRKQLKREDAIQSISPPSNNSGKLSEDIDSVKDMPITDSEQLKFIENAKETTRVDVDFDRDDTPTKSTTVETVIEAHKLDKESSSTPEPEGVETTIRRKRSLVKVNSDESDVVTPFEDKNSTDSDATSRLLHSGEFHDIVLPTKVSRGDTSVVRGE